MTEAERLQKIVGAQEKELKCLRRLLSVARIAKADYWVEDGRLNVVVTCIGADEYHFLEQCKPELMRIANAMHGDVNSEAIKITDDPPKDAITGEPLEGGVSPA